MRYEGALNRVLALAITLTAGPSSAHAESAYQVIVNVANPTEVLTQGDVARLFITPTAWESGDPVHPIHLDPGSPVRDAFSREILGVTTARASEQRMQVTGGLPPAVASDREVLAFVRLKRGAIGYVSAAANVAGVKVVTIVRTAGRTGATPSEPLAATKLLAPQQHVQATLDRYVAGLLARNIEAIKRIWPTMSPEHEQAMRTEFGYAKSIRAELVSPRIDVSGNKAIVAAQRRYQLLTTDGNRLEADSFMTIRLRDTGADWLIEDIQHRSRR